LIEAGMVRWKGTSKLLVLMVSVAAGFWVGSLLAEGLSTARAERGACAACPGEPSPLPHVDHPDPLLARWARLGRKNTELRATDVADIPPVSARPVLRAPDWSPIDAKLGAAEALVRGARFEQALQAAEQIRPTLASIGSAPGCGIRRAQLEVLSATAQIALGHQQAARESFERALAADPELELGVRALEAEKTRRNLGRDGRSKANEIRPFPPMTPPPTGSSGCTASMAGLGAHSGRGARRRSGCPR
jgi:hypothetical protein